MGLKDRLSRPPWRTLFLLAAMAAVLPLAYLAWSPGLRVIDGRNDLRTNGLWLQHGWLADDAWLARNGKDTARFRTPDALRSLADRLRGHGIRDLFPHACPCGADGALPPHDDAQVERFLDHMDGFRVIPWIGGRLGANARINSPEWRARFAGSAATLLRDHPRLAGAQVNIEPLPSGNADYPALLDELRRALPAGKLLSVAAYPPPTRWQPSLEVHWEEPYFRQVASRVDHLAVMMYDTGLRWRKIYQRLMADWTFEALSWAGGKEVLLGVPAYDDAGVGYHDPAVESLENALPGIHAGLARSGALPGHYRGIAVYCEWEMDDAKWSLLRREFGRSADPPR